MADSVMIATLGGLLLVDWVVLWYIHVLYSFAFRALWVVSALVLGYTHLPGYT